MGDRIVVMRDGIVEQIGTPLDLYDTPANPFVAGFIGSPAMNFIEGEFTADGNASVMSKDGIQLPTAVKGEAGRKVIYGIRPEHLALGGPNEGLGAEVVLVEPTGAETLIVVQVGASRVQALFKERHRFKPGDRIWLKPDLAAVHVFDLASGQRV